MDATSRRPLTAVTNESKLPQLRGKPASAAPAPAKEEAAKMNASIKRKAEEGTQAVKKVAPAKAAPAAAAKAAPPAAAVAAKKPARQAWDYKGRLEDLERTLSQAGSQNDEFSCIIAQQNERIQRLEEQRISLETNLTTTEAHSSLAEQRVKELEAALAAAQATAQREISTLGDTLATTKAAKELLEKQLRLEQEEVLALKSTVSRMATDSLAIDAQLRACRSALDATTATLAARDAEIAGLKSEVTRHVEMLRDAHARAQEDEAIRRRMHNTILELKGNIRVFCRVRPQLGPEAAEPLPLSFPDRDGRAVLLSAPTDANYMGKMTTKDYEFAFDKVFSPAASQGEVFEEISQLVQSALDGYNVTIFAYGQTGSGKTHTMEGGSAPDSRGMIPRAVEQIFATAAALQGKGWAYTLKASFIEIYNETIRDLLGANPEARHEIKKVGRDDDDIYVTDLTEVDVAEESHLAPLLARAAANRAVARTDMNERSSRSHSVFRLRIAGTNSQTEETCRAMLNLVDLAGSERLARSGSSGERLKETQSINTSLAALSNVIMALGRKDAHVPFRDSKLTFLLQPSLAGNSKTLMFVNVSPSQESVSETLCSLRFATKVNECTIGTARKVAGK